MPTEFPNKNNKRRRYRTRMFDDRFSFPTTSEQVRQLQAESDADKGEASLLWSEKPSTSSFPGCEGGGESVSEPPWSPLRARSRPTFPSSGPCGGSWALRKSKRWSSPRPIPPDGP